MPLKLKALGLSVAAMTAFSAFVALNAFAETGGHFTSDATTASTIVKGTESGTHTTEITLPGLTGIVCTTASYEGTFTGATAESITVAPTYNNCHTTGSDVVNEVIIHMNGCKYQFTIGKKSTGDNTLDLTCPFGNQVVITHPNCEIKIPPQNKRIGFAYTTSVENSKHSITVEATSKELTGNFESGFCVLLGTSKTAELTGSITFQGFNDNNGQPGTQVNLTATGSEG